MPLPQKRGAFGANSLHLVLKIRLSLFLFLLLAAGSAFAQDRIEIIHAEELASDNGLSKGAKRLIGNVALKQNDVLLTCDSAYFYTETNQVQAFSHVVITQGDSLHITCAHALYDGTKKQGELQGDVVMINGASTLRTDRLLYDSNRKLGYYLTGGTVVANGLTVTSRHGFYRTQEKTTFFQGKVVVVGTDLNMQTDSLNYRPEQNTADFFGPTVIRSQGSIIYSELGSFNTKTGKGRFSRKNKIINDGGQTVAADRINFDRETNYGCAEGHAIITDTANNLIVNSELAELYDRGNRVVATGNTVLKTFTSADTTYLYADTLRSFLNAKDSVRNFLAFHHVSVLDSNAALVCDSLSYSSSDSIFRCYGKPIAWFDAYQAYGDTLYIHRDKQGLRTLDLVANSMVINRVDSFKYNQIKGKFINANFALGKLANVYVKGNAQSIYYVAEDITKDVGVNQIACTTMRIEVRNGRPGLIRTYGTPTGRLTPSAQANPDDLQLKGFRWQPERKPSFAKPRPFALANGQTQGTKKKPVEKPASKKQKREKRK